MIKKLKELLERSNHEKTRKFFRENFVPKDARATEDPILEALLQATVIQMGIGFVALQDLTTLQSEELLYGQFSAGKFRGEYFYLPDIRTGMAWLHNSTALQRFRTRAIPESDAMARLARSSSPLPANFVPSWPAHPGWLQGRGSKSHWGRG